MQSNPTSQNITKEIVFDVKNEERSPWNVCGRKCSRSVSLFIIQSSVVFILIIHSVASVLVSNSCEETTVWVAILSSVVGYILGRSRAKK